MAALVTNSGLQRIGVQASQASGSGVTYASDRHIQVMSVDDSTNAIVATDDAANDGGAITNFFDKVFDATPTRTGEVISHVCTLAAGEANFTIRRILLHDDDAGTVSASSTTLVGGIDGQALTKTSDFSLTITVTITYSDNS